MEETSRYREQAPTAADFEVVADAAYRAIPARLRAFVDDVVIRINEFPDRETLDDLDIQSPFLRQSSCGGQSADTGAYH